MSEDGEAMQPTSVGSLEESKEEAIKVTQKKAPFTAKINGANIEVLAEEVPVMYRGREDEEWVVITFVLPFEPNELKALGQTGRFHDHLKINLRRLSVDINEPFELTERLDGMTIRIDK